MATRRPYALFLCHDWEYGYDYYRVCDFLDQAPGFKWTNLSVPAHDPLANDEQLEYQLRNQIRPADVVLVMAGMYTARSIWMDWEMAFARRIGTPIVGIIPWGNQRVPRAVQRAASTFVGWRTSSIVDAIQAYGRKR